MSPDAQAQVIVQLEEAARLLDRVREDLAKHRTDACIDNLRDVEKIAQFARYVVEAQRR